MNNKTIGVIGVCGANNNLIARILNERGYDVIGTDLSPKDNCRFGNSLENYNIKVYYGETPDEFFEKSDLIIPPLTLPKESSIRKNNLILELTDVLKEIHPNKPVFAVTGTNGKTTSTSLLKKIPYDNTIKPSEHNM